MQNSITWIGMDVHKESIVVAAVNGAGAVATRWETPNTLKGKERLAKRLSEFGTVRCAYEAGPCGYDLRRFLETKGIPCDVIAPSLIPKKPGDRVKTDKKDAEKIARMHRMGELTAICVPSPAQEALRDLLRAREDVNEDLVRRRHRLQKFLLRQGRRHEGKNWTRDHWRWIRAQKFTDPNSETVLCEYIAAIDQEIERIGRLDAQTWPPRRWHGNWRGLSGRSAGSEKNRGQHPRSWSFCGGRGGAGNEWRTLDSVMRRAERPRPALLERGSSRRIIVLRSNPRISA